VSRNEDAFTILVSIHVQFMSSEEYKNSGGKGPGFLLSTEKIS